MVALKSSQLFTVGVNGGDGFFGGAGQTDADVRVAAFPGAVDHTAHDGDLKLLYAGISLLPV